MSNGFEEAKSQRNWLERLGEKIPGFRGFRDRELRRDVDKMQREHMAAEVGRVKGKLRETARDYTDAGKIAILDRFERLDRRFDGLSQSIRFADYGATGLFDAVKIGEEELARIYEFDVSLLDDIAELEGGVDRVPPPDGGDAESALESLLAAVRATEAKWARREEVISNVVQAR
ncbi:MAG TPA: hypothetical protein VKU40_17530 [Thermoanaerobaculia bacterium]|nr:hypothetical protein [Thermoanaerobaculia bacterium]